MQLDHSVYPDLDSPPEQLAAPADRADYLHRICCQWDYGLVPEPRTFALLRAWKDVFDAFPVRHSAAYHAFRWLFGWEPVEGRVLRATYQLYDLREERADPCENWI